MTRSRKFPKPTTEPPGMETIEAWIMDEELPEATDGCTVESDGWCPDGHPSWLLYLGMI